MIISRCDHERLGEESVVQHIILGTSFQIQLKIHFNYPEMRSAENLKVRAPCSERSSLSWKLPLKWHSAVHILETILSTRDPKWHSLIYYKTSMIVSIEEWASALQSSVLGQREKARHKSSPASTDLEVRIKQAERKIHKTSTCRHHDCSP